MSERTEKIIKKFASQDLAKLHEAFDEIAASKDLTVDEKTALAEALATLFYRDEAGNEELARAISRAEEVMASLGSDLTSWLIGQIREADAESAHHFAHVLGLMGSRAAQALSEALGEHKGDDYVLINLLTSVGHSTDPEIVNTVLEALPLADHENSQVRAAALYCIGRVSNRIPPEAMSEADRKALFDKCFSRLSDPKPLVRRHAVRALGKMLINSYLNEEQKEKAHKAFRAILGLDEFDWDSAYIVRNEAEHYLQYFQPGK